MPTSSFKTQKEFYIPSLDGIRAVAFLLVFFHHGFLGGIIPGGFGVTTFFFLSGYLITTLLRMEAERKGQINLKLFYLRRVLRIFPPLYISVAFGAVLAHFILKVSVNPRAIVAQLLHCSNYMMIILGLDAPPPGTGVLWSLAVEEHFYLLFPITYIGLRKFAPNKPNAQAGILAIVCAAVLAWRIVLMYFLHVDKWRVTLATDTRLDGILFGCIMAIWANPILDRPRISDFRLAVVAAFAFVLMLVVFVIPGDDYRESFRYTAQSVLLFPLFVAAIRLPKYFPFTLLNLAPVRFLGVLSYSLYLFHDAVMEAVRHFVDLPQVARDCISLPVSILVALVLYYAIERPCAALRKRASGIGAKNSVADVASVEDGAGRQY